MRRAGILLVEVLDSCGAAREDAALRLDVLEAAGCTADAIMCELAPDSASATEAGRSSIVAGVSRAADAARAWLADHPGARVLVASAEEGGGEFAGALGRSAPLAWWPAAIPMRAKRWSERGRRGAPRMSALSVAADTALAALEGAPWEPSAAARGRLPLWDGDYVLAPATLEGRAGAQALSAFAELADSWSALDLVVLADPAPESDRAARELGVSTRVHFAGAATRRAELAWLSSASATLVATRRMVSAGLVVRALACRTPLFVAGDAPGARSARRWLRERGAALAEDSDSITGPSLERVLERGPEIELAVENGARAAAAHGTDALGARWRDAGAIERASRAA